MSPGYPLGDLISGLFGAMSVMVALYHRDLHGGEGQTIDLALYEAVFRLLDFDAIQFDQLGTVQRRTGNQSPYVAPSSTYRTRDGSYLTMAASTQSVWLRVCRAIGREDLVTDPRFADNQSRVTHSDEINGIVDDWIAQRSREEADRAVAGAFPRNDRTKPVAHGVDHRGPDAARGRAAGDDGGVRAAYRQPAREIGPEEPRRIVLADDPLSGARPELADDFGLRNTRRGSWHAAAPVGHERPGFALRARPKAILPGTG